MPLDMLLYIHSSSCIFTYSSCYFIPLKLLLICVGLNSQQSFKSTPNLFYSSIFHVYHSYYKPHIFIFKNFFSYFTMKSSLWCLVRDFTFSITLFHLLKFVFQLVFSFLDHSKIIHENPSFLLWCCWFAFYFQNYSFFLLFSSKNYHNLILDVP